ncbi:putative oxidoreductase TM_0325 [Branchiostoma floridae x Branchiostoma belcheri]
MPDFQGKVAIITGASSGIGRGAAVEFARLGAHMTLTGRIQENLQATAKACVEAGTPEDKILVVTGDICDDELRKNLVDQTAQKFSRIDVLVNNAGIFTFGSIETTDMAVYDKMMDVNVRSAVRLTQLCVPHLTKTKGAVVNVSSINGVRSMSGCLAYSISKVALDQFTRCVALELASKQIRVNSVK